MTMRQTKGARKPTPAQVEATTRNFRIFRLRGLYEQLGMLTGNRRSLAEHAIDAELEALGAEAHSIRMQRNRRELENDNG